MHVLAVAAGESEIAAARDRDHDAIAHRRVLQIGAVDLGAAELGAAQVGAGQPRAPQVGAREVACEEIGAAKVGPGEVAAGERNPGETCLRQIGLREIGLAEIAVRQIGPYATDNPRRPTPVKGQNLLEFVFGDSGHGRVTLARSTPPTGTPFLRISRRG